MATNIWWQKHKEWHFSWLERWYLSRLCRRLVLQGNHAERIILFYRFMREAAEKEFTEDNAISLNIFMAECHLESQMDYLTQAAPAWRERESNVHTLL